MDSINKISSTQQNPRSGSHTSKNLDKSKKEAHDPEMDKTAWTILKDTAADIISRDHELSYLVNSNVSEEETVEKLPNERLEDLISLRRKNWPELKETVETANECFAMIFEIEKKMELISEHPEYKKMLLKKVGLNVPEGETVEAFLNERLDGLTRLQRAAWIGSEDTVEALIQAGSNINVGDFYRYRPLHYAVATGMVENVRVLIDNGADVNAESFGGHSPLHVLCYKNLRDYYYDLPMQFRTEYKRIQTLNRDKDRPESSSKLEKMLENDRKIAKLLLEAGCVLEIKTLFNGGLSEAEGEIIKKIFGETNSMDKLSDSILSLKL